MESLRTVPKGTIVKELHFKKKEIEEINQILNGNSKRWSAKTHINRQRIKEIVGGSNCFVCGDIPAIEVQYPMENILRIERFCNPCSKKVYEKTKDKSNEKVAASYGIIPVDSIPHYNPTYEKASKKG
jgi:hypothetical protein